MNPTVIELTEATLKKHVVRFDTDNEDAPISNLYVANWWVAERDATKKGVRVTIEAL